MIHITTLIAATGIVIALGVAAYFAYSTSRPGGFASDRLLPKGDLNTSDSARSLFASWMSLGNVVIGALLLTLVYQIFAIWAVVTWIFGFILLMRHANRIHAESQHYPTILEFIEDKYKSRLLSRACSLLTMMTATGTVALEMLVGIVLLHTLGIDLSGSVTLIAVAAVMAISVGLFAEHGGMRAVFASDRVQSTIVMLALAALVILVALGIAHGEQITIGEQLAASTNDASTTSMLINLVLFFAGFFAFQAFILLGDLTTWQRLQFAPTGEVAKRACRQATCLNGFGWLILFIAGMLLIHWPASSLQLPDARMSVMEFAYSQGEPMSSVLHQGLIGLGGWATAGTALLVALVLLGMYSAILSTTDSYLITAAQAFLFQWNRTGRQVTRLRNLQHDHLDKRLGRSFRWTVWVVVVVALVLVIGSMYAKIPLVALIFFVWAAQLTLSPIAVAALHAPVAAARIRVWAFVAVIIASISILILLGLSTMASNITDAYSYSYAAPVVAVLVPLAIMMAASFVVTGAGNLKKIGFMMMGFVEHQD